MLGAGDLSASIAFYVLGALFFFIPLALVAAELATGWPRAGGIYAWVEQAFGDRSGFLAVWFEWVENIVWFPTVLSFVAATLAYVIDPSLADNKLYLVIVMLTIFWALTIANFFGMRWTARLNNPGVLACTLLPAVVLIGLGAYWLLDGRPIAIPFTVDELVPNLGSLANLVFFAGVLLGYAGIEMAGFHAKETRNPGRDYPRDFPGRRTHRRDLDPGHAVHRVCRPPRSAQSRLRTAAGPSTPSSSPWASAAGPPRSWPPSPAWGRWP